MNKLEHTPGPWTAHTHEPEENIAHRVTSGVHQSVPVCQTGRWDQASAADARLIAAAPDLLEACQALNLFARAIMEGRVDRFSACGATITSNNDALTAAEIEAFTSAAITRATGKE